MSSLTYTAEHLAWQQRVGNEYLGIQQSQSTPHVPALFSTRFSEGSFKKPQLSFRPATRGSRCTVSKKSHLQNLYSTTGTRFLYENGGKDCRGRYSRKQVYVPSYQPWPQAQTARHPPRQVARKLDYNPSNTKQYIPNKREYISPQPDYTSHRNIGLERAKSAKSFNRRYTIELEDQIRAERQKRIIL